MDYEKKYLEDKIKILKAFIWLNENNQHHLYKERLRLTEEKLMILFRYEEILKKLGKHYDFFKEIENIKKNKR